VLPQKARPAAAPIEVVASHVQDLSTEARTLEEGGMELAELLRVAQQGLHELASRKNGIGE
jgi:hypothetical protein